MQIYLIKQDICISIYMLPIAGQTGGPIRLKKMGFLKKFPRATPGISASNLYNKTRHSYMSPIAGQTAGPNGLSISKIKKKISRATPGY